MKKQDHYIIGVHVQDRIKQVTELQKALSEFGCNIKTRLGLHDASDDYCAPNGLILLELIGQKGTMDELTSRLSALDGIDVQQMVFKHE
jgi:hypothetical protein